MMTLNNPENHPEDARCIRNIFDTDELSSGLVGLEYGKKCKTPHWQIKITFKDAMRFKLLKGVMENVSFRDSKRKNCVYECKGEIILCKKPHPGLRKDLEDVYNDCPNLSLREIAMKYPSTYAKFHAGIDKIHRYVNMAEDDGASYNLDQFTDKLDMNFRGTHIVIGGAGLGKTQWALAHFKNPCLVTQRQDFANFERRKHDGIVIDDMDTVDIFPGQSLINILDFDTKRTVNIKYGAVTIPKETKKIICHNDIAKVIRFDLQFTRRVFVTEVANSNTRLPPSVNSKKLDKLF